mmetsp:Transcript_12041/g.16344  ORF Transcript_12041/g.16344 Transcript_12041/m.16344 type:complete len:203 (-) Transcript_12041:89-697(-)
MRLLHLLGERFVLHECLARKTFSFRDLFRAIKITLHVTDGTTEESVLADSALLRWIHQEVAGCDHNLTVVLLITVVLLHVLEILHVLVSSISRLSNVSDRLESLLVSSSNLSLSILFAHHGEGGLLEGVANRVIASFHEQGVIGATPLDRVSADVGRVDLDLLRVSIGDEPRLLLDVLRVADSQRGRRREQTETSGGIVETP